jgi:hypothetical protein
MRGGAVAQLRHGQAHGNDISAAYPRHGRHQAGTGRTRAALSVA